MKSVLKLLFRGWVVVSSVVGSLVLLLSALVIVVGISASNQSSLSTSSLTQKVITQGDSSIVALVNLSGPILDEETSTDPFSFSTAIISSKKVKRLLTELRDDESVQAVVIRINSPGGTVVASDELYRVILSLREKKSVVFSFGDVAASGGYYIASAGDKIVANPATLTGSIGVIFQFPELSGLYEKIGVKMSTFKSGQFKDIGSSDRAVSPQEAEIFDSLISDSYEQFIQAIVTGRNMPEATVRQLADGRVYSGTQAKQLGLVDELGTVETAISLAAQDANLSNPSVIEYSDDGFWEALFATYSSQLYPLRAFSQYLPVQRYGLYYMMSL